MNEKLYSRTVNVTVVIGVSAIVFHDRFGSYGWVAIAIAVVSALVATVAYFRFQWGRESASDGAVEGQRLEFEANAGVTVGEEAPANKSLPIGYSAVSVEEVLQRTKDIRGELVLRVLDELTKYEWNAEKAKTLLAMIEDPALEALPESAGQVMVFKDGGVQWIEKRKKRNPLLKAGYGSKGRIAFNSGFAKAALH